ncbi:MAG: glycosyltransferase [Flavobacteriales bacterium]|nr:glycosyltransferase [Flavobacteriales bacterium]
MATNFIPGLVSVVIPAYNQERFIAETLQSVLDQSYTNLEVVISDDASTDRTCDIIRGFADRDARIRPLFSEKNQGISQNFNRAFDHCQGEFTAFLGGDDVMLPGKIETQVNLLKVQPDVVLCHHDMIMFDSETGAEIKKLSDDGKVPEDPLDWVLPVNWFFGKKMSGVLPSSCLARSEYYLHGRYPTDFKFKHELLFTLDDYAANPSGKWHYLPEVLGRYRIHDGNFSFQPENRMLIREENERMCAMALERYPQLKKRIRSHRNYRRFLDLVFDRDADAELKRLFLAQATASQKIYLRFCRWLNKSGLLFTFFKPVRFYYYLRGHR